MTIAENLRQLRRNAGMTQEQVADRIGVTRQALSGYESGRTRPDIDMLLRLSTVYGTDLDGIVYGQDRTLRKARAIKRIAAILYALTAVLTVVRSALLWSANRFFAKCAGRSAPYKGPRQPSAPAGPAPAPGCSGCASGIPDSKACRLKNTVPAPAHPPRRSMRAAASRSNVPAARTDPKALSAAIAGFCDYTAQWPPASSARSCRQPVLPAKRSLPVFPVSGPVGTGSFQPIPEYRRAYAAPSWSLRSPGLCARTFLHIAHQDRMCNVKFIYFSAFFIENQAVSHRSPL